MRKRLTKVALFILYVSPCYVGGAPGGVPKQELKPEEIIAGHCLMAKPRDLVPMYTDSSQRENFPHPVIVLATPVNPATDMVPVAFMTHSPISSVLPFAPSTGYGIPDGVLTGESGPHESYISLLRQMIHPKKLYAHHDHSGQPVTKDDNLEKLLKDIDDKDKARVQPGSCVFTWLNNNGLPDKIPTPPDGQELDRRTYYTTTAIILDKIDAHGMVSVAEIRFTKPPSGSVCEPGRTYGLPQPAVAKNRLGRKPQPLCVLMKRKKVSYKSIYPVLDKENALFKIEGHKLNSDQLALLNKHIDASKPAR